MPAILDPHNSTIIWLTPQELAECRLQAEIPRQVTHGIRCSDPRALDALMEKYTDRPHRSHRSHKSPPSLVPRQLTNPRS